MDSPKAGAAPKMAFDSTYSPEPKIASPAPTPGHEEKFTVYHVSAMKEYQLSERKIPEVIEDMKSYTP